MKQRLLILIGILWFNWVNANESIVWKLRLSNLNTPHYNGGLPSYNRELATEIRESMLEAFPKSACEEPSIYEGERIGSLKEDIEQDIDLNLNNNDLQFLVSMLSSESQEVRDTTTYTLSLFGPVIDKVVPVLEIKRADKTLKGNWYNHALSKINCVNWTAADFTRVIPDHMLPDRENWLQFLNHSEDLLIELYKDSNTEFPPGMLYRNLENYAFSDVDEGMIKSLYHMLLDSSLSLAKRIEAADLLIWKYESINKFIDGEGLLKLLDESNGELKQAAQDLLIKLTHSKGLEIILAELDEENLWGWSDKICAYGERAIELENKLIESLYTYIYPEAKADMMSALACIKSPKALPVLRKMLLSKHWEVAKSAAENLGLAGKNNWLVRRSLKKVIKSHWSSQVKQAAQESLDLLIHGEPEIVEDNHLRVKMGPASIEHGMPECESGDHFSLDGKLWFEVEWIEESLPKAPAGFPADLIWEYRSHVFYPVEDGWLFGSEKGHYDGAFLFWSESKGLKHLSFATDIYSIFDFNNEILAIGYQIFTDNDAGVIFKIKNIEGEWQAYRYMTLPSPPFGYGFGPNHELLLKDYLNHYALMDTEIIPLKCRSKFQ